MHIISHLKNIASNFMQKKFYLFTMDFYYKVFRIFVFFNKKINTEYTIQNIKKLLYDNDFMVDFVDINECKQYTETVKNIFVNKNLINYFNSRDAIKIGEYAAKIFLKQQNK